MQSLKYQIFFQPSGWKLRLVSDPVGGLLSIPVGLADFSDNLGDWWVVVSSVVLMDGEVGDITDCNKRLGYDYFKGSLI